MKDNLRKRFLYGPKKKFTGKVAYYYPVGITSVDKIEKGGKVIIRTEPIGGEVKMVEVARVTGHYRDEIESKDEMIAVFLKDLSPIT